MAAQVTISSAIKIILSAIGEDTDREGLQKTPDRAAKALLYFTQGYHESIQDIINGAIFHESSQDMVIVRNIDISSLCEHHLVPFVGKIHIGYIPNGRLIGISKLARISDVFARRLQVQERLTSEIADAVNNILMPLGVAVVMECTHMCMGMRGVQKKEAVTVTRSMRGSLNEADHKKEFYDLLYRKGKS